MRGERIGEIKTGLDKTFSYHVNHGVDAILRPDSISL